MKTMIFLWSILFITTGCMTEKEKMLKQGHSVHFAQGYEDGCSTGHGEAGMFSSYKKDPKLSKTSADYKRGWNDGREFCRNQSRSNLETNRHYDNMRYYNRY